MRNYRFKTVLKRNPEALLEYVTLFEHAERRNRIGIFKARTIEKMQFDEVMSFRRYVNEGNYKKAFHSIFAFRINIPYLGTRRSDNDPETHYTIGRRKLSLFIGMPEWLVYRLRMTKFFPALLFIKEELKRIEEKEKAWSLVVDPDLQKAGIEIMDEFGPSMNVLRPLAKERGISEEELATWTYGRIHIDMSMAAAEGLIAKNYREIMEGKNKHS